MSPIAIVIKSLASIALFVLFLFATPKLIKETEDQEDSMGMLLLISIALALFGAAFWL